MSSKPSIALVCSCKGLQELVRKLLLTLNLFYEIHAQVSHVVIEGVIAFFTFEADAARQIR